MRSQQNSASKPRAKDLIPQTGDKFTDLYNMGKVYNKRFKVERTTEEIEFEKNKDFCTFTPNCKRLDPNQLEE